MVLAQQSYAMAYGLVIAFIFLGLLGVCLPRFRKVDVQTQKGPKRKKKS